MHLLSAENQPQPPELESVSVESRCPVPVRIQACAMGQSLFSQQLREARRPSSVAELDRLGVTRGVRRGRQWQRVGRGQYVPAGHDFTTAQRIQAAVPALPGGGAVGGWAAAFVLVAGPTG
jgi:hypothetical protein